MSSEQMKIDAWIAGYDSIIQISESSEGMAEALHVFMMPEFQEGMDAGSKELKRREMVKLLEGNKHE